MREPRLDGGPYFVQSELHRVSDRFVERFKIGVPSLHPAAVILSSI
jgi:hypothetical protein